ncbi:hypothetical protein [Methylobacterium oxalidis]|uniref:Uncharacterized protein n=1 Tax=Methylobacterium oxalidis TaxID=944322 RepID=A0A512J6E0_9HYPH|nr:hypothetical protein [Methylobacterium oxalidis]GEP05544.1 hypothetical protein MOX02_35820 [Methylobacterium oxalidis]GJE31072.1 hypothetical protein LDDCCGHA_1245 [Methylobacterium oxalidis]GLS65563.1 hypothetical protein GCM10007888_39450 [Methylobacterium oxalidis]
MAKEKVKVPKTLAGLSLPNRLRKSGALTSILNNPLARTILADVLVAAAGAAATALVRHRPSGPQVAHAGERIADAGVHAASATSDTARAAVGAIGTMVTEMASSVLPDGEGRKAAGKAKKKGKKRKSARRQQEAASRPH